MTLRRRPAARTRVQWVSSRPGPDSCCCVCTHCPEAASHTRSTPVQGQRLLGLTGPWAIVSSCCPPWPGPTHLGCQLSKSAGPWTSHPAGVLVPLATALQPPHSGEEQVRGDRPIPNPTPLTSPDPLVHPPQTLAQSAGPGGSAGPRQCKSCPGPSWGKQPLYSLLSVLHPPPTQSPNSCQGLGGRPLT